jgi:hypothetical protein
VTLIAGLNSLARFCLELCAVAALGYWGFWASDSAVAEWLLGVGAPLLFAMLWGALVAPRAPRRLADPARVGVEIVVFALAAIGLADDGQTLLALAFALCVAVNIGLMFALGQRGAI